MQAARAKAAYHHGDLRAALVRAAFAIAKKEGVDAVTLRAVAAKAGVSEAAPYHHFANKRALLAAAAGAAFEAFDVRLVERMDEAGADPVRRLVAFAGAYVAFAIDQPGPFQLIIGAHVAELELQEVPEAAVPGRRAKHRLRELCRTIAERSRERVDPERVLRMVWAQAQGVASLVVEKELHPQGVEAADAHEAIALAEEAVRRLLATF